MECMDDYKDFKFSLRPLREIVVAMRELWDCGIVHRDINPKTL